ncbi:cell division topological specificity factor [Agarivorans sp. OAG1]|uniref:Cell division topological specificity factor n=2 Tax=Agarivorans TaxID=261825 RepID=R9PIY9_AGAAL|nr:MULTISPECIES: cell division topological specificity factor MinE [Agarivorans]BEU03569.1 cell division topological specificity factor [Agarivorans sp. OAG1]MEE1672530.1 cell division topological specificity factor MinE [Agarivorans aestuarii]MPW29513.1 cell division topological specificity factor MinE [Agarivorans sp. B2Z047]UQN45100.1 cell division topological specificity factor MinE [Agarivorans sp. B2Z047]GAD01324.1 cell division topological specificity factor MinE [Agarivorans albus MKT 
MSLLDYFRTSKQSKTAATAKERLQIIVAHERGQRSGPDYLPAMKQDIIEVIKKYVDINSDQVNVSLDNKSEDISVLELNITLPEQRD